MATFNDAKEVAAEIVKGFDPLFINLFGSVARESTGNDLTASIVVDIREMPVCCHFANQAAKMPNGL